MGVSSWDSAGLRAEARGIWGFTCLLNRNPGIQMPPSLGEILTWVQLVFFLRSLILKLWSKPFKLSSGTLTTLIFLVFSKDRQQKIFNFLLIVCEIKSKELNPCLELSCLAWWAARLVLKHYQCHQQVPGQDQYSSKYLSSWRADNHRLYLFMRH